MPSSGAESTVYAERLVAHRSSSSLVISLRAASRGGAGLSTGTSSAPANCWTLRPPLATLPTIAARAVRVFTASTQPHYPPTGIANARWP
jgi:hypothetical protein